MAVAQRQRVEFLVSQLQWDALWSALPPEDREIDATLPGGMINCRLPFHDATCVVDAQISLPVDEFDSLLRTVAAFRLAKRNTLLRQVRRSRTLFDSVKTNQFTGSLSLGLIEKAFANAWFGNSKPTAVFACSKTMRNIFYLALSAALSQTEAESVLYPVAIDKLDICHMSPFIVEDFAANEVLLMNTNASEDPKLNSLILID